jgi:hypothetical protein
MARGDHATDDATVHHRVLDILKAWGLGYPSE